jgi:hypothetical protein
MMLSLISVQNADREKHSNKLIIYQLENCPNLSPTKTRIKKKGF